MKKLLLLIALIVLLNCSFVYANFLFPSARSMGYYLMPYTRFDRAEFPDYNAQGVLDFWTGSHDLLVTWRVADFKAAEPNRTVLKASNASCGTYYNYETNELYWDDMLTELHDWIQENWENYPWSSDFNSAEEAFEDCWLHLTETTTFTFAYGDPITIPAYDPAEPRLSRIPAPWELNSDWILNVKSHVYRDFWQDYYAVLLAEPGDGIFLDVHMFSRPGFDFGKIIEFASSEEYESELDELTIIIKNAMQEEFPGKLLAGNTWDYFGDYVKGGDPLKFLHEDVLDVHIREGSMRYTKPADRLKKEFEATYRVASQGKIVTMQDMLWFVNSGYCTDGYTECLARDRMTGLAGYYMAMNDNVYFFSYLNPVVDPYSCWFEAIAYDIGQPVGEFYVFAEGLTPDTGRTYKVFAREFTKGLVLFKPRPDYASNTYMNSTATTHELSETFKPLNANGSLGEAVSVVSLKNYEGMILAKTSALECTDQDQDGYGIDDGVCLEPFDCDDLEPGINPGAVEECNGVDEDCDGEVDEELNKECGPETSQGRCAFGLQECIEGEWSSCEGAVLPIKEVCGNGIDEDCDGFDKECEECSEGEAARDCFTSSGCKGRQECVSLFWRECIKIDSCCGVTCDDGNPCTVDSCDNGKCVYKMPDPCCGVLCEDLNPCTNDYCLEGKCVFEEFGECHDLSDFLVEVDEKIIEGKAFTVTVKEKESLEPVSEAMVSYGNESKISGTGGKTEFVFSLKWPKIRINKEGFKSIEVLLSGKAIIVPVSCGNYECEENEDIENCPKDCLKQVQELALKLSVPTEVKAGQEFTVTVKNNKGEPVGGVVVVYGNQEKKTTASGKAVLFGEEDQETIKASKAGLSVKAEVKVVKQIIDPTQAIRWRTIIGLLVFSCLILMAAYFVLFKVKG